VELKPGYKETEIGVIPEEWELAKLGARASFRTGPFGSAVHKSDYTADGVPVINPMHIVDSSFVPTQTMTLTEAAAKRLPEFRLKSGDVVIGRRGDMGRCAVVEDAQSGWLCGTGSMIIRCARGVSPEFIQRILSSPRAIAAIEDASVGSTMINLNQGVLAGLMVQLPPPEEQSAITAALSDVDALISALDRLIAKKRDLKQAAMQQLLTGQRRLPGFTAKWEVKRLGEVAHIKTGSKNNDDKVEDGAYPLFVRSQTVERINSYSYDCEAVLVPGEGGIGSIFHYINGKFDCHQRVYKISAFDDDTCGKFIFYCMKNGFYKQATRNSVKATVDSLRLPTFLEFEFLAPTRKEQTAVASVLSDMDAEIAALVQRRDKTRDLKQGMMQELLTGRTRLI